MLHSSDDLQKDAEKENANAKKGERLIVTKDIKTVLQIHKSAAKGHKTIKEKQNQWGWLQLKR